MTIDLKNIPLVKLSKRSQERLDIELTEHRVNEGRASRRIGVAMKNCPPYAIASWTDDWRRGWIDEDERISKRQKRSG